MEAEPRGSSARVLSPAGPGRERRPETSDGFRRGFGRCFANERERASLPGMGRQAQRSDGRTVRSHLVSSFAAALTGFSTRVKPPARPRLELAAALIPRCARSPH
ncbi:hypothetical protein SAMCCGM7_Ch3598 [Sinorhizobium americanum CCGM7]|nr:hypothetical protein SAMCCGM7_Ch3598 [Sinorhizobium americanum CCGM7]